MSAERIVIVGGGPAAKAAAEAYREAGGEGAVTILARESHPPYERPPLTKGFLRGETARADLPLADPAWYREREIELRTGTMVTEIDLGGPVVRTEAGEEIGFDRLLLATGADPLNPPIPGADGAGVQTMRRIEDAERLGALARTDSALVVGSGFVGCEAAASLALRGVTVTMATLEEAPQHERLGPEVAAEIAGWLDALGVETLAEAELAELRPAGDASVRARFTDRHEITVDRVLLALGVERNDGLASAAGLPVEDGVQVDASMATPDPRVSAAGDVAFAFNAAAGRRLRVEHWGEALNMGEVAGKAMAGAEAEWSVAPGFWSTIGERTIKYVGWGDGWDERRFEPGDEGAFACWYGRDGEVVGVAAHEDDAAYERGRWLIEERAKWS